MKSKLNAVLFLINLLVIKQINSFSLESLLGSGTVGSVENDNDSDLDSDDLILKLKSFFDKYANSVKSKIKHVDKLILPRDENFISFLEKGKNPNPNNKEINNNNNVVYVEKFDLAEFEKSEKDVIEKLIRIKERNLNNFREDKQKEEERNIDYTTKKKIYSSRMNMANTEMGKNQKDLNEKSNQRQFYEQEINSKSKLSEKLLTENVQNMLSLKDLLIKFNFISENLNLDKNTFKEELKLDDLKATLNQKIYKASKEAEFFSEQEVNKKGFLNELENLKNIFNENIKKIKQKNEIIESSIQNKTQVYKTIRNEIASKYDTIENLNNTATKLKQMQNEYKNNLRHIDDEIVILKSKKKIIQDNITQKKNRKINSKKDIENVLSNLEKEMDKFNLEEINLNKYRKEITSINNNLRNILTKENMIFKKNKIKI